MTNNVRSFDEMMKFDTFEERYDYLQLRASVGASTFGFDRWMNQNFYRSTQWKQVRQRVIARDEGCDLAVPGLEIYDKIVIHHMNPMNADAINNEDPDILNPRYLISCTLTTHNAIHFGDKSKLPQPLVERRPGDTTLWR